MNGSIQTLFTLCTLHSLNILIPQLCQGVMEGLRQTEKGWLVDLLQAFNEGNLARFYSLKQFWELQPDLLSNQHKLEAKIRLLCLMEVIILHIHTHTHMQAYKLNILLSLLAYFSETRPQTYNTICDNSRSCTSRY